MSIWHTDFLANLNQKLYANVLTVDNVITDEVAIKFNEESYYGFILQREDAGRKIKQKYFLPTDFIDNLPLVITSKEKFSYKGDAYWFIKSVEHPSSVRS
jgi:hypothetical protein